MELLHPVCAGLRSSNTETCRIFSYRHTRCVRTGAVLLRVDHAEDSACKADGDLCSSQYRIGCVSDHVSWLDRSLGHLFDELLHVSHVPHDLCARPARSWGQHKDRGIHPGDVYHRWSSPDSGHGTDLGDEPPASLLPMPCRWSRTYASLSSPFSQAVLILSASCSQYPAAEELHSLSYLLGNHVTWKVTAVLLCNPGLYTGASHLSY